MTTTGDERGEHEDLEDTVLGVVRQSRETVENLDEDTIVSGRDQSPPPLVEPAGSRTGAPALARAAAAVDVPDPTEPADAPPGGRAHAIRIGAHDPILLNVPALIGRRPSLPRITGTDLPRLVRVPSPSSEISATHLEVRQEGATVVVTDLGSTNGTLVGSPSLAPRKLRQGESLVVAVGSVVDIGDGIRIEILPATELLADEAAQ